MSTYNVYSFVPKDLTEVANQIKILVLTHLASDGAITPEVIKRWEKRAVLIEEPTFLQSLFGKLFTADSKQLRITLVEHLESSNEEKEKMHKLESTTFNTKKA